MRKCKKHPKYKAIRKPRCNCKDCWDIYRVECLKKGEIE